MTDGGTIDPDARQAAAIQRARRALIDAETLAVLLRQLIQDLRDETDDLGGVNAAAH